MLPDHKTITRKKLSKFFACGGLGQVEIEIEIEIKIEIDLSEIFTGPHELFLLWHEFTLSGNKSIFLVINLVTTHNFSGL